MRSSESITKTLISRRMPAITATAPIAAKIAVKELPASSARSSRSRFTGWTVTVATGAIARATAPETSSVRAAPPNTPRPLVTSRSASAGCAPRAPGTAIRATVPGATRALTLSASAWSPSPAMPTPGTTPRTVSVALPPAARIRTRSPVRASRVRAASSSRTTSPGRMASERSASPVAPASPPKPRAAGVSISSTRRWGSARRGPAVETATPAARTTGSTAAPAGSRSRTAASAAASRASGTWTISSTGPSSVRATSRTDARRLSPTSRDEVMIAAPSRQPTTTRAPSPRRRATFRIGEPPAASGRGSRRGRRRPPAAQPPRPG